MVGDFIREKIHKAPGEKISQNIVYEEYIAFCLENNEKPESKIWFGRQMNIFGYSSKQISNKERVYFDIGVKE